MSCPPTATITLREVGGWVCLSRSAISEPPIGPSSVRRTAPHAADQHVRPEAKTDRGGPQRQGPRARVEPWVQRYVSHDPQPQRQPENAHEREGKSQAP